MVDLLPAIVHVYSRSLLYYPGLYPNYLAVVVHGLDKEWHEDWSFAENSSDDE
jgi:hypothetical protein